jgi:hypothetical protein
MRHGTRDVKRHGTKAPCRGNTGGVEPEADALDQRGQLSVEIGAYFDLVFRERFK